MNHLKFERDHDLAILWLDTPNERVNKLSKEMLGEFEAVLDTITNDAEIKGAVLISRKADSFVVGADINELRTLSSPEEAQRVVKEAHRLLNKLASLSKPVVAAIHGPCVGGGLELVMACTYRLASEHKKTKFALPEVNLGLLPGAGGTQRLPRLVGVQAALEMMLTGKNIYPKPARRMGLVDALIHHHGLLDAAKRAARGLASGDVKPRERQQSLTDRLLERTPLSRMVYSKAEESVQKKTLGNYPAPPKIIECVRTGMERGMQAGLDTEARHFSELLFTPQSRALVHLFFLKSGAEKNPYRKHVRKIEQIGVLGAGLMGSGIAQISATGGYEVLLKDQNLEYAAKGKAAIWKDVSKKVGKGTTRFERDQLLERVTLAEDYRPFKRVDLVIEAVLEDLTLKRQVVTDVEANANEYTIFASNTSSIPIHEIAAEAKRPENVIGMHYFSPAQKMPLLEIITTERTPDWVLATAFEVGLKQGKTVIVVGDRPGFYVNRILAPYMDEALRLLTEGASVEAIDKAMTRYGFPVGPLKLLDEVGLDVGMKVTGVMRGLFEERGVDLTPLDEAIINAGIRGRKSGRGFYVYQEGKKNREVNRDIYRYFSKERKEIPEHVIQERLVLAMINEAAHCLHEGVIKSPADGDVGAVFGIGFPPFLGGPFWHMDQQGIKEIMFALERLQEQHGIRFLPATTIREYALEGKTFYDTPQPVLSAPTMDEPPPPEPPTSEGLEPEA